MNGLRSSLLIEKKQMSKLHEVLMPDGETIVSRDTYILLHPAFKVEHDAGDLVMLAEGVFVLNADLIPVQLANETQVLDAIVQEWNDKPDWAE